MPLYRIEVQGWLRWWLDLLDALRSGKPRHGGRKDECMLVNEKGMTEEELREDMRRFRYLVCTDCGYALLWSPAAQRSAVCPQCRTKLRIQEPTGRKESSHESDL